MRGIVDRIEGDILILEVEDNYIELNLDLFPSNIKEGDMVKKTKDSFLILEEETKNRKAYMEDLLNSLFDDAD